MEGGPMATIKQIAEKTGYSQSTVSIVLRNRAEERKIPEKTQRIILQAAKELNYQPSMAARRLRSGEQDESLQIALLWAQDFRASMMVRFLKGLRSGIEKMQLKIHLTVIPYSTGELEKEKLLRSRNGYHGAIICNASEEDMKFLHTARLPVPVVLYNRESEQYSTVCMDNAGIGQMAAEILKQGGSRRVQMFASAAKFPGAEKRDAAFEQRAKELGLEVMPVIFCESSREQGRSIVINLSKENLPDGIFCGSDAIALGVLRGLHEKNVACPQRVKVLAVGNGEPEAAAFSVPSLSVISLPMEEMAEECLKMLADTLTGVQSGISSRELPVRMILRESVTVG